MTLEYLCTIVVALSSVLELWIQLATRTQFFVSGSNSAKQLQPLVPSHRWQSISSRRQQSVCRAERTVGVLEQTLFC